MIDPDITILSRCHADLAHAGLDLMLAADPSSIAYLTGFAPTFESGPNPWAGGPPLVVFAPPCVALLTADGPTATTDRDGWTVMVRGYPAYTCRYPLRGGASFQRALSTLFEELVPRRGKVGIEAAWVPAGVRTLLGDRFPGLAWVEADGLFDDTRMVKSAREIARMRDVIALGDVMQQAVRDLARVGMTDIEVFGGAKARMETAAGGRVAVRAALRGGCGSSDVWDGDPHRYGLQPGDLLLSDLVPHWHGYWADSCSTMVVGGQPSAAQARLHHIVREALEVGIDAVRPGVTAGDLDRRVRGALARHGYTYPHHTGHGIGVGLHEQPYIWTDAPTVLREGMIIALEPGVYEPDLGGIRQEVSLLVTVDGAEVLSHNALSL